MGENGLEFHQNPKLSGNLFDENNEASFTLFGKCTVVYHNERKKNTYGEQGAKIVSLKLLGEGNVTSIEGNCVNGNLAEQIRDGKIQTIHAFLA